MKITKVTALPLVYPYETPIMDALSHIGFRQALLVRIDTDAGIYGIGESAAFGGPMESTQIVVEKELAPKLIGEDPTQIEWLWQKMFWDSWAHGRRGIVMCAMSGIDIALWDILGKAANMPVYKLLGGYADKVELYASGGFYSPGKGLAEVAAEAASYIEKGYRAVKMKIGRTPETPSNPLKFKKGNELHSSVENDLNRVAAVRQAIGSKSILMVDANAAWNTYTAIAVGKELQKQDVYWIEEPTAIDNIDGCAQIARELDMLVAGYESEQGAYMYREIINRGAVDVIQPDLTWSGGFTECRRIAALGYSAGKICAPHVFSSAIAMLATAHFSAAIPDSWLLESDENPNELRTGLLKEPYYVDKKAFLHIPDRPGIGAEIDWDVLEKYLVKRS